MDVIQKNLGPSIGEQNKVVNGWWKYIAEQYNSKEHHSMVQDIPAIFVMKLLVEKGIVQNEHNGAALITKDLGV